MPQAPLCASGPSLKPGSRHSLLQMWHPWTERQASGRQCQDDGTVICWNLCGLGPLGGGVDLVVEWWARVMRSDSDTPHRSDTRHLRHVYRQDTCILRITV